MFPAASLITALLLAISIAASPVEVRSSGVTLPIAKHINANGGAANLVQYDQARAAALREGIQGGKVGRRDESVDATNRLVSYTVQVKVGMPSTTYNLLIDTGSSNTWVGADLPYTPTSSSEDTGDTVSVSYGSGSFSGEEWVDAVVLAPLLSVLKQSIGVASQSTGISPGIDGLFGIGPTDLTLGTLSNKPQESIPTITDNLYSDGMIDVALVSVSFEPTTSNDNTNGELTFGTTDPSKYTGDINYVPITTTSPASNYWGIDQSITYGSDTILSETAGIVDTGTTLILLATDGYQKYMSLTGAVEDGATGLLELTASQYDNLENLDFHVGSVTYSLTPNGQIWPRSLNSYIGGASGAIYSIVGDAQTPSGQGLDFLNGQTFLERFYSVYDTTNGQVGLATTPFTDATTN